MNHILALVLKIETMVMPRPRSQRVSLNEHLPITAKTPRHPPFLVRVIYQRTSVDLPLWWGGFWPIGPSSTPVLWSHPRRHKSLMSASRISSFFCRTPVHIADQCKLWTVRRHEMAPQKCFIYLETSMLPTHNVLHQWCFGSPGFYSWYLSRAKYNHCGRYLKNGWISLTW